MRHPVTFVSQRKQRKDWMDYSCGVAAMAMLLSYVGIDPLPNFTNLGKMLWIEVHPKFKVKEPNGWGVYESDVARVLEFYAMGHRTGSDLTKEGYEQLLDVLQRSPTLIGTDDHDHWCLAVGNDGGAIQYLDPWDKREKLRSFGPRSFGRWDGCFIVPQRLKSGELPSA